MKASDYVAQYLERNGTTHVFELVGGMITFLLDSLHRRGRIEIVSMHHEQGAGFAAEGYGRVTGRPGVAMATSGPGATNLLTAVASCYFDSVPAVFITGQVNRHEQKGTRAIRQLGFQETDIVAMARPVTKAAWLVDDPARLPEILDQAFALALSGRPGPVIVDLPMDVQRAEVGEFREGNGTDEAGTDAAGRVLEGAARSDVFLDALKRDLGRCRRPLILAGGGVRAAGVARRFRDVVERWDLPVVNSLMAVDVLPAGHPRRIGLIGSYGNRWANMALAESDLLWVIGSRLDVRQTGADTVGFKGDRPVYHVDCEPGELNNRVLGCTSLVSQLAPLLQRACDQPGTCKDAEPWTRHLQTLRDRWPDVRELADVAGINPNLFLHQLSAVSGEAVAFVADVGQHQMWAAQSLDLAAHQRFITSGGMGAMGFALPAAIGVCLGAARKPVVVVAGDGGFQLNIQELQTVVRNRLPIKLVVINNGCHGMVRQFQDSYFKGRVQSTVWGYSAPSFAAVAEAYGISSRRVEEPAGLPEALAACWAHPDAPFLLEVMVAGSANAYPKMAFGRPISEMEPFAKPLEMEGT